jgi:hypothetical protein
VQAVACCKRHLLLLLLLLLLLAVLLLWQDQHTDELASELRKALLLLLHAGLHVRQLRACGRRLLLKQLLQLRHRLCMLC